MADDDSPKFKIRFDDEGPMDAKSPKPLIQEKVDNLRLNKLSRRINLVAVLIPCLLALIVIFGYLETRKDFNNIHLSGYSDIRTLSKDLDSKFSSLSIRQAKIEALLNEKISAMEKTAARLEQNLEQTEKALAGIRSSTPDKQELAGIIAEIDKTLAPIHANIKKLSTEIKKVSSEAKALQDKFDKTSGNLSTGISGLQKEISKLKTDTADLASSRVDKKTFDLTVRHQERFIQQKLTDLEKSLLEQIESLRKQINALEDKQKNTAATGAVSEVRKPVSPAPPVGADIKSAIPQPGKIIEQEIKK